MAKYIKTETIKKLIKDGFDLELISFELGIPIERVKQCELELKMAENYNNIEKINNQQNECHKKINIMRDRYSNILGSSNEVKARTPKSRQPVNNEFINSIIEKTEKILEKMREVPLDKRRQYTEFILSEIKPVENLDELTIEQAENILNLLESEELKDIKKKNKTLLDYGLENSINIISKKLLEAIDSVQEETDNIKELKKLNSKITLKMQKRLPINASVVKNKIENKIYKISQKEATNRIRTDVSRDIELVVKELAKGTLNVENGRNIIIEEAKKRIEKRPKNIFAITEEQEIRQILVQIKIILTENPKQYHIKDPEKTIEKLQELFGNDLEEAIKVIVKNLTNGKDFERAKEVCKKFSGKDMEESLASNMRKLKKKIGNEEIGDIVLKVLNSEEDEEKDRIYFEFIERCVKDGRVKPKDVILGKRQNGLRNITLADIWVEEKGITLAKT